MMISLHTLRMLAAIKLDSEPQSWTVEIQNKIAGGVLPSKIHAKLPVAQLLPELHFNIGGVAAKPSRSRSFEYRPIEMRSFDPHPARFARRPPPFRGRYKRARMITIFGIPSAVLFGQLLIGLINGSFYALLSLGLAVIFGMLNIINFAHGAQYMLGAVAAYLMLNFLGIGYWPALILAPIVVGISGVLIERMFLQWLYKLDHLYGLLLTFGIALIIEGVGRNYLGTAGLPYTLPDSLKGGNNLGFMYLPNYRAWVIAVSLVVCFGTWFAIERTRLGAYLRAATENPTLVRAFGINVPRMITLTYGFGVALAAFAGVMAAPIYNVSPNMGSELIIVVFAVVVIGGMGSILGAIISGFGLGVVEGLTKVFYPEASNTVIFVVMAIVLLVRPAGLFGRRT
jgi:branched-chain amino acid transport system permease protein